MRSDAIIPEIHIISVCDTIAQPVADRPQTDGGNGFCPDYLPPDQAFRQHIYQGALLVFRCQDATEHQSKDDQRHRYIFVELVP